MVTYEEITVTGEPIGLTPAKYNGADAATIQVSGGIRFTCDTETEPSATVGTFCNDALELRSPNEIEAFKAVCVVSSPLIPAKLRVQYHDSKRRSGFRVE
jgi:hypothetical protein